jgi:hypothetical protein
MSSTTINLSDTLVLIYLQTEFSGINPAELSR